MKNLRQIDESFQTLLAAPRGVEWIESHAADDLMVWFLLGGKDVGKSTFLNALLGTEISSEPDGWAEGTSRFVAYVHESAEEAVQSRLAGLPVEIRCHVHESEAHRCLCLIDSPDFDSRYERHVSQVREILGGGVADGAVLLASPAKYKDEEYWSCFAKLSGILTARHILFVLTKADELGDYIEAVRKDFARTVRNRRISGKEEEGLQGLSENDIRVFAVNSLNRSIDFPALEASLLRRISVEDVRAAQEENRRHAMILGAAKIREHYRLDAVRKHLDAALAPSRVEEIFDDHFPEPFFHAVAARLSNSREITGAVEERLSRRVKGTLAGIPALFSLSRWLTSRPWGRLRVPGNAAPDAGLAADMARVTRWDQQDLGERLAGAQKDLFRGLRLDRLEGPEAPEQESSTVTGDLTILLEDRLSGITDRGFSRLVRLILNLPVYLYLLLFVTLLFYPVFLLLKAWNVMETPDPAGILTLDNVKVSVIGFLGYYIMAAVYTIRRRRDRVQKEMDALAGGYVPDMRQVLLQATRHPLDRFAAAFERLEECLAGIHRM